MKKTTTFLTTALTVLATVAGTYANEKANAFNDAVTNQTLTTKIISSATDDISPSRLWINLLNADKNGAQTALAYLEETTTGLDYGYDAARFHDPNTISLYSVCESAELVIQARPLFTSDDEVVLGYSVPVAGTYSLHLYQSTGVFADGQKIYIFDTLNGSVNEINSEDYFFETAAGKFNDRFKVVYTPVPLATAIVDAASGIAVASSKAGITVKATNKTLSSVVIYDLSGRVLYRKENINTNELEVNGVTANTQIAITQIVTTDGTVHSKKILL